MKNLREIRIIAALLTIIAVFFAAGTCAEASVPEYRTGICFSARSEDDFEIVCCGGTVIRKGEELHFSYRRSADLEGFGVSWEVSDGIIAGISDGKLTAYRTGLVRVTATCGWLSSSCWVEVQ